MVQQIEKIQLVVLKIAAGLMKAKVVFCPSSNSFCLSNQGNAYRGREVNSKVPDTSEQFD